ncbi:uncharacterized protein LOC121266918 [Juglans microcarpa x Juglans regia]|uniref:uncharacterized protein LOC121266918 n=1 Tax=Juglans microcarpa x Juglans regia TaxID=2249226 RepID=UPI001B7EDE51|nr:uncharacterized protein LOC121266918 [Juglans microcarpa x Juglans regia]
MAFYLPPNHRKEHGHIYILKETAHFQWYETPQTKHPPIMASVSEDPAEHDTRTKGLADMEDEDLFEINLEAVDSIPPPHYWDSYFTATGNALLANCLLPISDVSVAVPIVSKDVSRTVSAVSKLCSSLSLAGTANFVMITEPMPLGELLRLPIMGASFGVPRRQMKA